MNGPEPKPIVLIVDDDPVSVRILQAVLQEDYEIWCAADGAAAIDIAMTSSPPPDLILLDVLMPGMDGYHVCRALKAERRTQRIPIIFITAMVSEEDETKGLEVGAVDYITKPFSTPVVKARVKAHVNLKRYQDTLTELSMVDGLTGVANRRWFDQALEREWRRAERAANSLSVTVIDIDYFKLYNDRYGHQQGDECLRQIAQALARSVQRAADRVARYGGEEFAVILPDTNAGGAMRVASTMRQRVAALGLRHERSTVADHVTVSIGAASVLPTRDWSASGLFAAADRCLYQAKNDGRDRIRCVDLNTGQQLAE